MAMKQPMASDEGEMNSLYASGEGEDMPAKEGNETVDQEEMGDDATALVPMKILQGKHPGAVKEGDEVVLKVVAVHGDEAEVAYSETKPGQIGGGEEMSANDEIDSMNSSKNY